MKDRVKFFKTAFFNPKTGAIVRSSHYVIDDVLKLIGHQRLKQVIEYGPGDGVMTRALLKCLEAGGTLTVVEADSKFLHTLQSIKDPRLRIIEGTIQEVSSDLKKYDIEKPDLVVSSIPFSLLKLAERERVVQYTYDILPAGGKFIVFHQYSWLMLKPLRKKFKKVATRLEPRNLLPCFIFCAEK